MTSDGWMATVIYTILCSILSLLLLVDGFVSQNNDLIKQRKNRECSCIKS